MHCWFDTLIMSDRVQEASIKSADSHTLLSIIYQSTKALAEHGVDREFSRCNILSLIFTKHCE